MCPYLFTRKSKKICQKDYQTPLEKIDENKYSSNKNDETNILTTLYTVNIMFF